MSEKSDDVAAPFGKSSEDQLQKKIFQATFSMLAKLTSIDGDVSKNEVQLIDRFMKEALELTPERRKYAIKVFNEARRDSHDFEHYAKSYAELMADKPKMREWMLDVLLRISLVDGEFAGSERFLVEKARSVFKISEQRFEQLRNRYLNRPEKSQDTATPAEADRSTVERTSKTEPADPYAILRIAQDASDDEVLAAYRRLAVEYGPSRIIELGLPDEFVELAERLFGKIQTAYQAIKKDRGL